MRVLLVDPSGRGGIADYSALVADALVAVGAVPELLASRVLDASPARYPVVRRLPNPRWGKPACAGLAFYARRAVDLARATIALERAVRGRRPNVVHFQAGLNRRTDAALVRRLRRRTPVVWTAHDVLPFVRTPADEARFAAIYRAVDATIVHTEPAAEHVLALSGRHASVVPHPVAPGLEEVSPPEARRRLALPEHGRILAAVGFVRAYKGYELLADVWEQLGDAAPLLFVQGEVVEPCEWQTLERLAACPRTIVRRGFASADDLHAAIAAADAILLPYAEASDSGILHLARAHKTPVIASDAPELAASVTATGAGAVVPRTAEAWKSAVTGTLPPAPRSAPPLEEVGHAHLEVYRSVLHAKRLHVVTYTDATDFGGAEKALATLVSELPPDLDVTVVGIDAEIVRQVAQRRRGTATLVLPPVGHKTHIRPILEHLRAIRRLRPQVFHANLRQPWSCQYGLVAAALTPGARIVAVEHAVTEPANRMQSVLRKFLSRRLDAHVAVGEQQAAQLAATLGLEQPSIRVIRNPVEDVPVRSRPRQRAMPVVGVLARLSPEKGIDVLVEALAAVPGAAAVVVGEGPERRRLQELAERLRVADRLELAGFDPDGRHRLADFDVLALPSRAEGLPLAAVEALLAEVPVVASDVGSVSEVVIDGFTGLLVPPGDPGLLADALRTLLGDANLRRRLGRAGRMLALDLFAPHNAARAYRRLYSELCG